MRLLLAFVCFMSAAWTAPAWPADLMFHIVEVVQQHEVQPRIADYTVRFEGDYFVGPDGVSVTGFGVKGVEPVIPYDQEHHGVRPNGGAAFVSIFHRLPNGFEMTAEFDSFVVTRRVLQTGPRACTDDVKGTLKPGHRMFEDHRISNGELMLESSRFYSAVRCELPKLTG